MSTLLTPKVRDVLSVNQIIGGVATFDEKVAAGDVRVDGRSGAVGEFLALLDDFNFWFNIVTPRPPER